VGGRRRRWSAHDAQKEIGHHMKTGRIFALALAAACLVLASAACNKSGKSPTGTAKAIYDSLKSKDVAMMKNAMSKGTLNAIEQSAKQRNKSTDDLIKESFFAESPTIPFEVRNEKTNGDMGTLEVKTENEHWQTFHFVKEDGLWKWDALMTFQAGRDGDGMEGGGNEGGGHGGH
jgi:hypothetical protein